MVIIISCPGKRQGYRFVFLGFQAPDIFTTDLNTFFGNGVSRILNQKYNCQQLFEHYLRPSILHMAAVYPTDYWQTNPRKQFAKLESE